MRIVHWQRQTAAKPTVLSCDTRNRNFHAARIRAPRLFPSTIIPHAVAPRGGRRSSGGGDDHPPPPPPPPPPPAGSEPPQGPVPTPPRWVLLLAAAVGYVCLGLLQPWRLLELRPHVDTSEHTVAIVVPVLNEEACIEASLARLSALQPPPHEIIVVDGGSSDNTVKRAAQSRKATRILRSPKRGRAAQMNAGAAAASSQLLCFCHADTTPPHDLVAVMRRELADPDTVLAGFSPLIEYGGRRLWGLSVHNALKTYYGPALLRPVSFLRGLRCLFGDQTLFCRASDFGRVGGYDDRLCIMEDADLCLRLHNAGPEPQPRVQQHQHQQRRGWKLKQTPLRCHDTELHEPQGVSWHWLPPLRRRGRVVMVLDRVSVTSGRRLAAWGALRATAVHIAVAGAWYAGCSPERLQQLYDARYTDVFR